MHIHFDQTCEAPEEQGHANLWNIQSDGQEVRDVHYYQGARRFGMQANKPYYVYAAAGTTPCLANPNRKVTANSRCLSWQKWVSIP